MKTTFRVPGMSCAHCEKSIKEAVSALQGVEAVTIDLADRIFSTEYLVLGEATKGVRWMPWY